jgi:hypothetical protein
MSTGFTPNADLSRLRIADSVKVACLRKPLNCSRESPRRKAMAGSALAGGNPLATPRKFMDSFYTLNNDYFNEMDQGAAAAAAALNITESLTTAIAESSLETLIASMSGCAVRMSAIAGAVVVRLHPPGRRATSLMPG